MKGYDRPLRPSWIYDCISLVSVGDLIRSHNDKFDTVLWQLEGKEGKRKVRTVLTRYYMRYPRNAVGKYVDDLPILRISKSYTLQEAKPLLLFYLLLRAPILLTISKMIHEIYGREKDINYRFLRKKIIEKMGDRDISPRSLRNFLQTLEHFGVLEKTSYNYYRWKGKVPTSQTVAKDMLFLYATEYLISPQIHLDSLEEHLLMYFDMPDLYHLARRYDGTVWEYLTFPRI